MATQMLTVQKGTFGLGPHVEGAGQALRFGHGGSNEGFRCEVIYFPEIGAGAAVMTNGDAGSALAQEILYAVAAEYRWPEYGPREVEPVALDSTAAARLTGTYGLDQPAAARLIGRTDVGIAVAISLEGGRLFLVEPNFLPRTEVVVLPGNRLLGVESGLEVSYVIGPTGVVDRIELGGIPLKRKER
jgi:hypothetical protein